MLAGRHLPKPCHPRRSSAPYAYFLIPKNLAEPGSPELDIEELAAAYKPSTSSGRTQDAGSGSQATIKALQDQLALTQQAYLAQKEAMEKHFQNTYGIASKESQEAEGPVSGKGKKRDDDTHYFNSYSQNGGLTQRLYIGCLG